MENKRMPGSERHSNWWQLRHRPERAGGGARLPAGGGAAPGERSPSPPANCPQPFRDGGRTWEEAVAAAYEARTQLSAFGFYNTSPLDAPSPDADSGSVFLYLTNGVGCSLVELDCLTGGHAVLRWPRAQPPSPGPTLSWTSAGASTLASTSGRWRAPSCRASATPPWRSLSPPATGRSSLSRRWWRPLCAGTWGSTRCRPWRTCRGS